MAANKQYKPDILHSYITCYFQPEIDTLTIILKITLCGCYVELHITANNSSGQITLNQSNALSVFVSLDAGGGSGIDADWWLAAYTPSGWYYYVYPDQWYYASVLQDILPAYQGPLFDLSPLEILNITQLPVGAYTVYFGVDLNRNGIIDFDQLYLNSIGINVVP